MMDPNSANIVLLGYSFVVTVIIPLSAALIGALAGGYMSYKATLRGVRLAHEKDLQRQKQVEERALQNFYQAIESEIFTIWAGYISGIGRDIEELKNGELLFKYYSGTHEYFPIFKGNTNLIGQIPDRTLRNLVVITYTKLQGLVDALVLNNKYLEDYQRFYWTPVDSQKRIHAQRANAHKQAAIDFAKQLKSMHEGLKPEVRNLLRALHEKIGIPDTRQISTGNSERWYVVTISEDQIVDGKLRVLQDQFESLQMAAGFPKDMALFCILFDSPVHIYFSSGCAPHAKSLIDSFMGSPCNKPSKNKMVLLVGLANAWELLEK